MCWWPCCCNCKFKVEQWPDVDTGYFERTLRVTSLAVARSLVSSDGTTIGCRSRVDTQTMRIDAAHTPCMEVEIEVVWETDPGSPSSYNSAILIGQTFSEFSFAPDGGSHTVKMSLDKALRYEANYRYNEPTDVGEVLDLLILDASVPTSGMTPQYSIIANYLAAKQDSYYYIRPMPPTSIATFNGITGGSTGTYDTGTWHRRDRLIEATMLLGSGWSKVIMAADVMFDNTLQPDMSNGAPTIYYGWASQLSFAQDHTVYDTRRTRSNMTFRLDRFCMTID